MFYGLSHVLCVLGLNLCVNTLLGTKPLNLVLAAGASPAKNLRPSCTAVNKLVSVAVDLPAFSSPPILALPQKLSRPLASDMRGNKYNQNGVINVHDHTCCRTALG